MNASLKNGLECFVPHGKNLEQGLVSRDTGFHETRLPTRLEILILQKAWDVSLRSLHPLVLFSSHSWHVAHLVYSVTNGNSLVSSLKK